MKNEMQETSLEAYHTLENLGQKQKVVYNALAGHTMGMTNRQLARSLGWEINRITPRVNELVKLGLIQDRGIARDPQTGKRAIIWGLAISCGQLEFL